MTAVGYSDEILPPIFLEVSSNFGFFLCRTFFLMTVNVQIVWSLVFPFPIHGPALVLHSFLTVYPLVENAKCDSSSWPLQPLTSSVCACSDISWENAHIVQFWTRMKNHLWCHLVSQTKGNSFWLKLFDTYTAELESEAPALHLTHGQPSLPSQLLVLR